MPSLFLLPLLAYILLVYVKVILVTVVLTYGFLFFVQISHVEGQSMEPNYHEGNIVLVNKQFYHYDDVKYGDVVFHVSGSSQSILKAERLVLNSMQRMSAIATKTKMFVDLLEGTKTKILDTRKTTPGIRAIEKWAVKIGGGENHRFALYDMIMLKDNHNDFAGGIPQAIAKTKQYLIDNNKDLKIIVEARNLDEVQQILDAGGVYRILLDNFDYETTKKAVAMIGNQSLTESSGNINEKNHTFAGRQRPAVIRLCRCQKQFRLRCHNV